jgi:thioredoxin
MKTLFVLVIGVLFCVFTGCKDNQQPPVPISQGPSMLKPVAKKIVVYDFWAPWCGPCRAFAPTFEKWKTKYSNDNISFVKVNTDEDKETAAKFKISALPTIIVTHDGVEVQRFMGAPKEEQIVNLLK